MDLAADVSQGSGPNTSTLIFDLGTAEPTLVTHRASFLRELLKPLPQSVMHTSKKLVHIETSENGQLKLHFQDGSMEHADALIGADGIHSYVRRYILGSDHPAAKPVFAGWWGARHLVPYERAKQMLGEKYFEEDRQYAWLGEGAFMMHDVLENRKMVQVAGAVLTNETWDPTAWTRPVDRKKLEESFAPWLDGPIAKGMINVSQYARLDAAAADSLL